MFISKLWAMLFIFCLGMGHIGGRIYRPLLKDLDNTVKLKTEMRDQKEADKRLPAGESIKDKL